MKHLPKILSSLVITAFAGVLIAHAAETSYVPLAPLPIGEGGSTPGSYTMSTYLSGMLKLLIALGGALSILMAIIGGTQYVASGITPDAKNNAKDRIANAFIGLAIVLTSYLVLNSINPALVSGGFTLPAVGTAVTPTVPPTVGAPWPDDAAERSALINAGVSVKTPICTTAGSGVNSQDGQHNCTSVHGLPSAAISGVIALKNACNCSVVVTQGTEYWLHQTHGTPTSFASVVDLRYQDPLSSFITTGRVPANPQSGCGIGVADHYSVLGATYVLENPGTSNVHWHVCY